MRTHKNNLTTGQIARALEVSCRTASNWCDDGLLPFWRVPHKKKQGRDRRIKVSDAIAFAVAHGLPLEGLCGYQVAILLLSPDVPLVTKLRPLLPSEWETTSAGCLVAAGVALARRRYNAVLLDGDLGAGVHEVLAHLPALQPGVPVFLVESEDGSTTLSDAELARLAGDIDKPSVGPSWLAEVLRQLATAKASNGRKVKAQP